MVVKTCKTCATTKSITEFYSDSDYVRNSCKECVRAKDRERYITRKQECIERASKHYYKNREDILAKRKHYNATHRPQRALLNAKRRAKTLQATPEWRDVKYMQDLYANASEATKLFKEFGVTVNFEVDHIVPLNGKTVCGFHSDNNLQILPAMYNQMKSNSFDADLYDTQWGNV